MMGTGNTRRASLSVAAVIATAGLALAAGCSDSADDGGATHASMPGMTSMVTVPPSGSMPSGMPTPTPHSAVPGAATASTADVMFAQMMIPHHAQAVQMSDTLLTKAGVDPRVADLAERIRSAQQPEIDAMTAMLTSWGSPMPAMTGSTDMGMTMGMDHPMEGLLDADEMAALTAANGSAATVLYLDGMIGHHEGAITMAEAELADGTDPAARELAAAIIAAQRIEIAEMTTLLAELGQ